MNPVAFVESTRESILAPDEKLTEGWGILYQVIHTIHKIWRVWRKAELYGDANSVLKLAAGHTINWLAGENRAINVVAHLVLLSTRVMESVEQQERVVEEIKKFWKELYSPYKLPPSVKWKKKISNGSWLSLSDDIWLQRNGAMILSKLRALLIRLAHLLKQLFLLSMKTLDAVESFYYAGNREERLNEFFINSGKLVAKLVENKELLLHYLEKQRLVLSKVLENCGAIVTVDQLIDAVKGTIGIVEEIDGGVNDLSEAVGEVVVDFSKRVIYGGLQIFDLLELLPKSWVPPLRAPWVERALAGVVGGKKKIKRQFLPSESIKRPATWEKLFFVEADRIARSELGDMASEDLLVPRRKELLPAVRERYVKKYHIVV